ncbi:hypothetical protein EX30DRAFT_338412 [Ascodesmis nigricans]|uniref:Sacsin/Nov domain-containing protein n=1 Tax=Ascodesmis nigricans TaxID=341454 RepID=A0A4V3SJF3_9PEZI|nr:hypothetical protein EX30DRAFT_338412 [Ascodesmis nigricans]
MTDYEDLRAQTLGSNHEEEAVTVNTRALIDKVLARYSSENTTLRELIQNAADANANSVEIHFQTVSTGANELHTYYENADLENLQKKKVRRLLVKNDGQNFREEDWQRLKRIAEGNPDETKIGAFGVGFYSVFADTDEPFISSGDQTMAFYWKGNSLFTRRGKMEKADPFTTFLLDYREPGDLPDLKVLCQFFATSLTFVKLNKISLFVDDLKLLELNKKASPPMPMDIPSSVHPVTHDKLMKVAEVSTSRVQLDAKYMNVTHYKPASETAGSFMKSFFKVISSQPTKSKGITLENIGEYTSATIFLRIVTATVATSVAPKFAAELERATKKPPPAKTMLSCLTMSKDEQDASEHESEIFENVIPSKGGRIFIGFPTHQTTAFNGHISAHSVIPTVERENIDLNARVIKTWNIEMLRVAGIIARITYIDEMSVLERRSRGLEAAGLENVYGDAIHIMKQFTFVDSTPQVAVGYYITEAFWTCTKRTSIELLSTKGVLPSTKVRLASDIDFLDRLPLLPEALVKGASGFVSYLKNGGYLTDITITDIQQELAENPLTGDKITKFLRWLSLQGKQGLIDELQMQLLLSGAVAMVSPSGDEKDAVPTQLHTIRHYINVNKLAPDLPIPSSCMPFSITKSLTRTEMEHLRWEELPIGAWLAYVATANNRLPVEKNLEKSPQFAATVLQHLSKNWETISQAEKITAANLLKTRTCIPTKQGMKTPPESYFPTVKLFEDLPVIHNVNSVKEKVLTALGVRKTIELRLVFERLMTAEGAKWSHVDLVKYLTSVQEDIPSEDIRKLQHAAICRAEPGEGTPLRKVSELYIPGREHRLLELPVLQWPGEWRMESREARFLIKLGLRMFPTEEVLVPLFVNKNATLRERAFQYFITHFHENKYNSNLIQGNPQTRLPLQGNAGRVARPYDIYSNPDAAILGFHILRSDLVEHAAKFGVQPDPPLKECAERLCTVPPSDRRHATAVFEYFSSRITNLSQHLRNELGRSAIVPIPTASGKAKHVPPQSCYIGPSDHRYAAIFDFVSFSPAANAFLLSCGSKPEPTTSEIAYRLAKEPSKLYGIFQSEQKYLGVLRTIADEWQTIKKDKELVKALFNSPCLGAYRTIEPDEKSLMDGNIDKETAMREFVLAKGGEIFILDDIMNYNIFKSKVLIAPEEDALEGMYKKLGATMLTSNIQQSWSLGPAIETTDPTPLRKTIIERTRLFLHNINEEVKVDASWLEKNLDVQYVRQIKHHMELTIGGVKRAKNSQDKSAAVVANTKSHMKVSLVVTPKFASYDLATALVQVVLYKPKPHSSLLLDSLLSTDLMTLKARGYNVDRILRQKQAEAQLMEEARLKKLEEQQKAIEAQEKAYQDRLRAQQVQNNAPPPAPSTPTKDKAVMPGAFNDTPPDTNSRTPNPQSQKAASSFFSRISKYLTDDTNTTKDSRPSPQSPGHNAISSIGGGPLPPPPPNPSIPEAPTEPHRLTANLHRAISSTRPHSSTSVFTQPQTFDVKESHAFCDSRPGQDIVFVADTPPGLQLYMSRSLSPEERTKFLSTNMRAVSVFAVLLSRFADGVFGMQRKSLHVYYDTQGGTIAFNLAGSVFCNVRFFMSLHAPQLFSSSTKTKPSAPSSTPGAPLSPPSVLRRKIPPTTLQTALIERPHKEIEKAWKEAVKYWYVTLCHELAHNLVDQHGSEHSFYTESMVTEFWDKAQELMGGWTGLVKADVEKEVE